MPRGHRQFVILALSALAIGVIAGFLVTRETSTAKVSPQATRKSSANVPIVDQTVFNAAVTLQNVASTAAEQELAAQAVRVADHEVDLAFASALRRAKQTPPAQTKETAEINSRISILQGRQQSLQAEVDRLTRLAANPGRYDNGVTQQQLQEGKAQLTLLQDALDDARQDLIRAGGDPEAQIQQELEDHEALQQHGGKSTPATSMPQSFQVEGNLVSQLRTWVQLSDRRQRLLQAQQQVSNAGDVLTKKHEALEKGFSDIQLSDSIVDTNAPPESSTSGGTEHTNKLAKLNQLSLNSKTMASYDKRIDLERLLAVVYGDWAAIIAGQIRLALHAILRSLLWIVLALLGLVIAEGAIEHFYLRLGPDRHRFSTTRMTLRLVSQFLGLVIILLALFGVPSRLSTVLALAGAGLTVALKDFIVAFFGWFILMGRNGIRVGDWVEINGIGGEVLEIGPLRTILLETGTWNDAGHPTGRRVSFVNSFAIEQHYFNFTTSGQWLWDELDILIPAGEDPYELTNSVLKLVTERTEHDAQLAGEEWKRVTHHTAIQTFSALPAIEVRPTNLGVNLVVRYIVHAHERAEVRTRLYQAVVELLHHKKLEGTGAQSAAAAT